MFVLWLWSFISQPHPLTLQSALLHQCLQFPHYSIAPPFTLQHRLYIRASPFALQPLYITVPLCIQVPVYITVLLLLWCPPFTSQPLLFPSQTSSLYNSVLSSHLTSQSPSSSHQCLLSPLYITAPSLHPSPPLLEAQPLSLHPPTPDPFIATLTCISVSFTTPVPLQPYCQQPSSNLTSSTLHSGWGAEGTACLDGGQELPFSC